ncbi:CDP-alcohol phosphatidyltransferase family protein [Sphingomonas sp.]|uniref:CDP-alcohol phosphatidyltransferase family protein n=1 Tax=Sphingomonas sp. TaxID=28214 RepID=UPI000DB75353|nr:CDP-alcohol phosphatidyltransferase family protein [Sphingomonas sp.]PZU11795.1 MAG: phosphatidylglycerophosphate synthase [Sphingomonas sp.]
MTLPPLVPAGENDTLIWGLTTRERLRRIAAAQGFTLAANAGAEGALVVNLDYVFDPLWLKYAAARPGHAITRDGVPVIAHVTATQPDPYALDAVPQETTELENQTLRKRERPFMEKLTPASVGLIERASYWGAYKGVTDILTKYMWPEWAFHMTRIAARWGITPNQVTTISAVFCVIATWAFWTGDYWPGLAAGLFMMILDTVDGKLARCTITSSAWGNIFDHGMDLIHPPFWWYAWGVGLIAYGRRLSEEAFWLCMAAIMGGYVVQRLIEGGFIALFGIHIHVWRRFDSWFRLITARRNPNMPILAAFLLVGRPDWGLIAVAWWTIISLGVHAVQFAEALIWRARGRAVRSWLE